jgi:DNA uptake protein ComE-like DNA-binding protein/uncharacterized RDD family membrane protein YckC
MSYATFWQRFAAMWIDLFVLLPIMAVHVWLESESKITALVLVIPMAIVYDSYSIYCHGRFGQTVGKRVMGIRVVLTTGEAIGWRTAWLRSSVDVMFSVLGVIASFMALTAISDTEFYGVGWMQQSQNLSALEPAWLGWTEEATQIWVWSEVVVMLFNKRRQALHDFIAGTVVITMHQEPMPLSGMDNFHQSRSEKNALVLVIPRWLVFSALALIVLLSLNTPRDARLSSSKISKPDESTEVRRPSIVNVNRATLAELEALPRVSERIALAIIDGRPYSSVDDLIRVYGIGPKTLENIRPFVKVDPPVGNPP